MGGGGGGGGGGIAQGEGGKDKRRWEGRPSCVGGTKK